MWCDFPSLSRWWLFGSSVEKRIALVPLAASVSSHSTGHRHHHLLCLCFQLDTNILICCIFAPNWIHTPSHTISSLPLDILDIVNGLEFNWLSAVTRLILRHWLWDQHQTFSSTSIFRTSFDSLLLSTRSCAVTWLQSIGGREVAIRTDCLRWFGVKAACLLAEDPDNRDEYGNLRSRRPPEPEGPPPKSEPVREVITSSVVHLASAREVTTGSPGTLLVSPPPAPPATIVIGTSTIASSTAASGELPKWLRVVQADATRTGWVPGWAYIAPESGASEPSVAPVTPPICDTA